MKQSNIKKITIGIILILILTLLIILIYKKNNNKTDKKSEKVSILNLIDFNISGRYTKSEIEEDNSVIYVDETFDPDSAISITLITIKEEEKVDDIPKNIIDQVKQDFPDSDPTIEDYKTSVFEGYKITFEMENYKNEWYSLFDGKDGVFVQVIIDKEKNNTQIEQDAEDLVQSLKWKNDKDA